MDVLLYAQFTGLPGGEWYPGLEVFDLEPVFDIYSD